MSCPSCDHTMQALAPSLDAGSQYFWCPRCGTIRQENQTGVGGIMVADGVPRLVERCRKLKSCMIEADQPEGIEALQLLGITESIEIR